MVVVLNKKIDVFKNNVKVASIGDINYKDYPTYPDLEAPMKKTFGRQMEWEALNCLQVIKRSLL